MGINGRMAGVLLAGLLLAAGPAAAQTQAEMNDQACGAYKQADAKLNTVYKQILAKYKSDTTFLASLRTAQRAWIAFRDAHLASVYPEKDTQTAYGSIYPVCACGVLTDLTEARVAQLQVWLDGVEEGDVCSGSVGVR
jgi:Uncharacterized protein conserved in bacteria